MLHQHLRPPQRRSGSLTALLCSPRVLFRTWSKPPELDIYESDDRRPRGEHVFNMPIREITTYEEIVKVLEYYGIKRFVLRAGGKLRARVRPRGSPAPPASRATSGPSRSDARREIHRAIYHCLEKRKENTNIETLL
jgi:hypothetical protein